MKKGLSLWARYKVFKEHIYTLYLVLRHPETPGQIKLFTGLIILYIFSPFDLLPDLYPFIGYLDELILTPLFVDMVLRLVPAHILASCQMKSVKDSRSKKRRIWFATGVALLLILGIIYYLTVK